MLTIFVGPAPGGDVINAEIKLSDWLLQVMWLDLTNQSALFQFSVATQL